MATFIKAGFWDKLCQPCKGYKGWLNLDELIQSFIPKPKYKVYTALLTQTGGDNSVSVSGEEGTINIGVTYLISENPNNNDLTIYGAPNNNEGTYFVANQTGILNYTDFLQLIYNAGAPVVTVLENTIGNIWFSYDADGFYYANSSGLFITDKITSFIGTQGVNILSSTCANTNLVEILTYSVSIGNSANDILYNTPIEIRVYS